MIFEKKMDTFVFSRFHLVVLSMYFGLPLIVLLQQWSVFGWGPDGHAVITGLLKPLLSTEALRFLITNLGDGNDLYDAIAWPDSDDAETKYRGSSRLHYSFTPYRACDVFNFERDCLRGRCVVSGIAESAMLIADPETRETIRVDHMKFLLHFLGDIHQPLHTGFEEDHGGGDIELVFPPNSNLHEVWDSEIVSRLMSGFSEKNLQKLVSEQSERLRNDIEYRRSFCMDEKLGMSYDEIVARAAAIASDTTTSVTCNHAYTDLERKYIETNSTLSRNYLKNKGSVVLSQLTKAAVRSAEILNEVAKVFYERKREIRAQRRAENRPSAAVDATASVPSTPSRSSLTNQYANLLFEFDPEEVAESCEQSAEIPRLPEHASADPVFVKKPKYKPEKLKPEMFEGVDLSRIVLFKFKTSSRYVITYREFAERRGGKKKGPVPTMDVITVTVGFENGSFVLHLDRAVFGDTYTKEVVVRCLMRLKGIRLDASTSIGIFMDTSDDELKVDIQSLIDNLPSNTIRSRDPRVLGIDPSATPTDPVEITGVLRNQYFAYMGRMEEKRIEQGFLIKDGLQVRNYERVRSQIFKFSHGGVLFWVHPETIRRPQAVTRFNLHTLTVGDARMNFLVDPKIFDGDLPSNVKDALMTREKVNNGRGLVKSRGIEDLLDLIDRYRPTFTEEMNALVDALLGRTRPNRYVTTILMHEGDEAQNFRVLYYILDGTPNSAFLTILDTINK